MTERNCKNCACYAEVIISVSATPQPQCMRNGPVPGQVRVERPVLHPKTKEVIIDPKTLQPRTESTVEHIFLYAPTHPDKTCFDGWRPIGVLPGEKWQKPPEV